MQMTSYGSAAQRGEKTLVFTTRKGRRGELARKQRRAGIFLSAPALIHISIFIALPFFLNVFFGFTDYAFSPDWKFVWFQNYLELFKDDVFRTSLVNTLFYSAGAVPVAMAIALTVAVGLNRAMKGAKFLRSLYYVPTVTASIAVGTIWLWIYQPNTGLASHVLQFLGIHNSTFMAGTSTALPSVIVVAIWQGIGAKMIIYLAALQGVPVELKEAANLDGANAWQTFRNVVWPHLGPAHLFVLVTSVIASFQVFDLVYVMSNGSGGPVNSTRVVALDVYKNAFDSLQFGYACAESVILIFVMAILIFTGFRLQKRAES
jgi:ABC-type sugar transport system permease subunit